MSLLPPNFHLTDAPFPSPTPFRPARLPAAPFRGAFADPRPPAPAGARGSRLKTAQAGIRPWSRTGVGHAGAGPRPAVIAGRDRARDPCRRGRVHRSEEHTSELQSLMRISYDVF